MPIIRSGKELVGGSRDGKELQSVYVGDKLAWSASRPIEFDAVGSGGYATNNGPSVSLVATHASTGNLVLAWLGINTTGGNPAASRVVTYGGTPMDLLYSLRADSGDPRFLGTLEVYALWRPPSGTQNVSVTVDSGDPAGTAVKLATVSYRHVKRISDIWILAGESISNPSANVPESTEGEWLAQAFLSTAVLSGYNRTLRWINTDLVVALGPYMRTLLCGDTPATGGQVNFSATGLGRHHFMAIGLSPTSQ